MKAHELYNALIPTMKRLDKEGHDVWSFANQYQGYGFNLIEKDHFIHVWLFWNGWNDAEWIITKHKRDEKHPNIIDSIMCEELAKVSTRNTDEVYNLVIDL